MVEIEIETQALSPAIFAPFGDVLALQDAPSFMINQGMCGRHHDLARVDVLGENAQPGISLFDATARDLPYKLEMMERHPLGSQAFIPMTQNPFLVIVAPDNNGVPGLPLAFLTKPGQGVNYHPNIWHGVLTPLYSPGLFAVVDRIGHPNDAASNLEEFWFSDPYIIR